MRPFAYLYEHVMRWVTHPFANRYLAALSFAESSFFPIPPDVMLAPMALARPDKAMHLALLTTVASVLGGVFGYLIGYFAIDLLIPWLRETHYWPTYLLAQGWFERWGIWVIFVAGFTPIPYKLFTISAGALGLSFAPFIIGSLIGRGLRFFLVAGLLGWLGPRMEPKIRQYIEWLGWVTVILSLLAISWLQLRG